MARIEKTVFISYRRTDVYTALAVYENLKNQGYDVFFDYRSISSGDFEQIINSNIRARAHFLLILTPTTLDRCSEPGDWLRREIEFAIEQKRNIIPLFFKGFRFDVPSVSEKLTGKQKNISRYNGLNVHEDYFDEAMHRLRTQYLNKPLDTVLHPVSTEVRKVVKAEQIAADKALEQIDDVKELVKQTDIKPVQMEELPKPFSIQTLKREVAGKAPWRTIEGLAGGLLLIVLSVWGGVSVWNNFSSAIPEPTRTSQAVAAQTSIPAKANTPSPTETSIPPIPTLGIGSTMISDKDGMTLLYVPAGEFTMGSDEGGGNVKPVHLVYLDAYWIDRTEVTTSMYTQCVQERTCKPPSSTTSFTRASYYGVSEYGDYPVIYVSWEDAKSYCSWANRRLPTEAEWEKAARGTNTRNYPWGNNQLDTTLLNYDGNVGDTTRVGNYPDGVGPYGALDMAGNVAEWVADVYSDFYYAKSPKSNPLGPEGESPRVVRGGAWNASLVCGDFGYGFYSCRGTPSSIYYKLWNRKYDSPLYGNQYYGFRCAMDASP